ncbi:hypothetical protein [Microbacterium lacticum]
MIVNPTPEQRKELAAEVLAAADLDTLPPSKRHGGDVRRLQRKLTFGRGAVPSALASVVHLFLLYGDFARAYRVASVVERIDPETWDIDYNYVRGMIQDTAYEAHRLGYLAEASELQSWIRHPAGYTPPEILMNGSRLRHPFSEENMTEWRAQPVDMTSTIAGEGLMDLSTLGRMRLFGGSREWPRERIDAFYDETVERIKALPGWATWEGTGK